MSHDSIEYNFPLTCTPPYPLLASHGCECCLVLHELGSPNACDLSAYWRSTRHKIKDGLSLGRSALWNESSPIIDFFPVARGAKINERHIC